MKCTSCSGGNLNPAYLDALLPCHACDGCGGSLLRMTDYFRWRDEHKDEFKNIDAVGSEAEAEETTKALICPKSGGLMTKYRISADSEHRLDFSAAINAVWLDKGEWELLKTNGMVANLGNVFTKHWQQEIREVESAELMQEVYQKKFGEFYQELQAMRATLSEVPDRHEALAYLMADDPYTP